VLRWPRLKAEVRISWRKMACGRRCFSDMHDSSDIHGIVEPLFMGIDAEVELLPVMNVDDLRKGLKSPMDAM
jgi:hypothetical protein